uniref:Uncharacterized protein n=1 Tax=Triticum urartu TaxID=4572 RepID=A0A8R7TVR1_TRIUA
MVTQDRAIFLRQGRRTSPLDLPVSDQPRPPRACHNAHYPETGIDATEYNYVTDDPSLPEQPGARGSRG